MYKNGLEKKYRSFFSGPFPLIAKIFSHKL